MVVVFIPGLGPTLLTTDLWIDDRYCPPPPLLHAGPWRPGLPDQPPAQFCSVLLACCSVCAQAVSRVLPESVTGMLATSGPGYIKPYWCASKTLPKLADDANAAKAVGGDRCYLSSPAPCSQIVPANKPINLIDQHISFTATFTLQLGKRFIINIKLNDGSQVSSGVSLVEPEVLIFNSYPFSPLFFCGSFSYNKLFSYYSRWSLFPQELMSDYLHKINYLNMTTYVFIREVFLPTLF